MAVRVVPAHGVGGGMERVTWTLAGGLAARGHDVTLATTEHPSGRTEEHTPEGFRVVYVGGSTWRRYRRRWWDACYAALCNDPHGPYDAILSQSAGALGYLRRAADDQGLPTVVLLFGSARAELRTAWRGMASPRGAYRLARLGWRLPVQAARWHAAAPSVAAWLAVSPEVAAENRFATRPRVVALGVDIDRFRPDPAARTRIRHELAIPGHAPVVALATRLEREKGVDVALDAARLLRRLYPELTVVVAGTGHDEARLRARATATAGDTVRFLGLVDHDRLPALLAAADLFVHPSLCAEARPLSIAEAAATGLPVVAADSPGVREVVLDGRTGVLVPRGDPAALAQAVDHLLADPPRRTAMAAAARATAESDWSTAAMVDAVEDALAAAAAAADHRPTTRR